MYSMLCPDLVSVPLYSIPIANYYVSNFYVCHYYCRANLESLPSQHVLTIHIANV